MSEHIDCEQCGADLEYKTGTHLLTCPYCAFEQKIEIDEQLSVEEQDLHQTLQNIAKLAPVQTVNDVNCKTCGASTTLAPNQTAGACDFCDTPFSVKTPKQTQQIEPQALLPFSVLKDDAFEGFQTWLRKLWFAPNKLKKLTQLSEKLKGVYLPFWTYDANARTQYRGRRGTYYYVTESYTTVEDGKSVRKTRQVRKTRWRSVSGTVNDVFDDVLVPASKGLPEKKLKALEPWDLPALKPFNDQYLAGFNAQRYAVGLEKGFDIAKVEMEQGIRSTVKRDIGGDEQRISQMHPHYSQLKFKHILLPVWLCAYEYKNERYQILINARTGEVQGERPYSWVKITSAVVACSVFLAGIAFAVVQNQQGY